MLPRPRRRLYVQTLPDSRAIRFTNLDSQPTPVCPSTRTTHVVLDWRAANRRHVRACLASSSSLRPTYCSNATRPRLAYPCSSSSWSRTYASRQPAAPFFFVRPAPARPTPSTPAQPASDSAMTVVMRAMSGMSSLGKTHSRSESTDHPLLRSRSENLAWSTGGCCALAPSPSGILLK